MKTSLPRLRLFALIALAMLSLLGGCAGRSQLSVFAINNPAVDARQTFVLENGNVEEPDDGLRFQETVEILKSALATRGMYEAPHRATADVIVRVETRVEGPLFKYVETLEVNHSTPSPHADSAQLVSDTKKTIRVPYYRIVLTLTAVEEPAPPAIVPVLVWKVEVATESDKVDVRSVMPLLANTGADYVGEETKREIRLRAVASSAASRHVPNRSRFISR